MFSIGLLHSIHAALLCRFCGRLGEPADSPKLPTPCVPYTSAPDSRAFDLMHRPVDYIEESYIDAMENFYSCK